MGRVQSSTQIRQPLLSLEENTMANRLKCENCTWIGEEEDCPKYYRGNPLEEGDVEPYLVCPICGNENLIPLTGELVSV